MKTPPPPNRLRVQALESRGRAEHGLRKSHFWAALACITGLLGLCPVISTAATQYVEGDVIVTFRASTSLDGARSALGRKSMALTHRFGWLSAKRGRQMGLIRHKTKSTAELIAELKDDPSVETVEPNYLRWINGDPNDTRFSEMWALHNTGQSVNATSSSTNSTTTSSSGGSDSRIGDANVDATNGTSGTAGDDVKFDDAWSLARATNNEVVVGVIDTGVDYSHPDLAANMWTNSGEHQGSNGDNDGDGYPNDYFGYNFIDHLSDPWDSGYHGTHVAGTIAAVGNNALGTIGVNYHAKIMALRVSSDGDSISTSAVIEALQFATMMKNRGVNIVALNASYGGGGNSSAESAAIQAAGDAGIILCAAAGNDSSSNDVRKTYPASYRLPNMIVVAATDQNDALASFSNFGTSSVDIAAPGKNILSTQPSDYAIQVGDSSYTITPMEYSGVDPSYSGTIYDCGIGNPAQFPAEVRGNIALIQRGTLHFDEKVTNAMAAGAKAVIIWDNLVESGFQGTLAAPGNWIPAGSISNADGVAIKAALPATGTLVVTGHYQYLDGTSMATPHVTGAVAFAAMNFPNDTVPQRIQRILNNVDVKLTNKVIHGRLNLQRTVDANLNGVADWLEKSSPDAPTISSSGPLVAGTVSYVYSQTLSATGGTASYSWTLLSGDLPPGLALSNTGTLEGTPTAAGSFTFAVQVTDSVQATSGAFVSIEIATTPLAITSPASLDDGTVGDIYTKTLTTSGGAPPYTWSLISGDLPPGLSLSSAGSLTGTPATMGTFTFDAEVTDGSLDSVDQSFSLTIGPPPLVITTPSPFVAGALGLYYSKTLAVTGGTGDHTWTLDAGALPDGLSLSSDGVISGEPTSAGTSNFTVLVTDEAAATKSKSFSLTIEATPVTITTASILIAGVKTLAYTQIFAATGGSGTYSWIRTAGALPTGMSLSSSGILTGKPTAAGISSFTLIATDSLGLATSQNFTLTVTATYVKPAVNAIDFGTTTVGMLYTKTVTATNYPKSFYITHLPAGLRYIAATGVISGRPTVSGNFDIQIRASNPGGASDVVTSRLVVNAIPTGFIGSFTGIISRDPGANANLGGRLTLTTTPTGAYTARITTGATTKSAVGYLVDTAPQISVLIGASTLTLTFDSVTQLVSGTYGAAAVSGWRSTWTSTHKPTTLVGYYTVGISLADVADQHVTAIPQGSGYASFTVAAMGTLTVAGKLADGTYFTTAGFLGPNGEIPIYSSLYVNLGSLVGKLTLTEDANQLFFDNTVSGILTWLKPTTKTRTYPTTFGPLNLSVYGKYLAVASSRGITSGLPAAGSADLVFAEGGVELSATQPDVTPFTYTATKLVSLPQAGLSGNLGKATLNINKYTGLITGAFTLVETSPVLTRRVTFQGMVVRPASGNVKAMGYFLLLQIPATGQTIYTSPILSGNVVIDQSPSSQ